MAKNSEWGAVAYLSHSSYGLNGTEIEPNTVYYTTGGSSTKSEIYTTNAGQSTTGNAYGVYDMSGGVSEYTANYVNYTSGSFTNGGNTKEDLYNASNPGESTKYKTVYEASGTSVYDSYNLAAGKKGDGIYETSDSYDSSEGSWFGAYAQFPNRYNVFLSRGGQWAIRENLGIFYFDHGDGASSENAASFRIVLTF